MGENSAIEWTDHTFNPWTGCTRVSPGCQNCYAERQANRFEHLGDWGPGAERKRTSEANWRKPLAWNRKAEALGTARDPDWNGTVDGASQRRMRPRVFCASMADWLDDEVDPAWLADLLALVANTPHLNWLLLSKRPQLWEARMRAALDAAHREGYGRGYLDQIDLWLEGDPPPNVWVGTTVEDQRRAEERLPHFLSIPARVRFLSCEPLLGDVYLPDAHPSQVGTDRGQLKGIHWVIAGGESGPGARPMHPAWARSLRDQCAVAGVPFHFKQWGRWAPHYAGKPESAGPQAVVIHDGVTDKGVGGFCKLWPVGKKIGGRLLDERQHDGVPVVRA